MEQKRKPNWWLVYLTVPLMIGALLLEANLPYAPTVHRIMELGIVVVGFGLMAVWVRANAGALMDEEIGRERWVLLPPSADSLEGLDSDDGTLEPDFSTDGELDSTSKRTVDPNRLPGVEEGDDSEVSPYQFSTSSSKGRYN